MSALCALALAGALSWRLPMAEVTLAWTHSVERTEWRETWLVENDGLRLKEARIKGSGAGMEPGETARLEAGWWVWQPETPLVVASLLLARSGAVGDYLLCDGQICRPLEGWLPGLPATGTLTLQPC